VSLLQGLVPRLPRGYSYSWVEAFSEPGVSETLDVSALLYSICILYLTLLQGQGSLADALHVEVLN